MRIEYKVFLLLVPFFVAVGVIYAYFTEWEEWVGIVGLALTGILCGFIGFFLWLTARKLPDRPEDDLQGEIAEAEGNYGFFAPYSWWPLWLGASSAGLFLGAAIGWWLVVIAVPFVVLATVGWTFEYFHGDDAV